MTDIVIKKNIRKLKYLKNAMDNLEFSPFFKKISKEDIEIVNKFYDVSNYMNEKLDELQLEVEWEK